MVALLLTRALPVFFWRGLCPLLHFQESVFHGNEYREATHQIRNLRKNR
jgi:hypothetical protein